MENAGIATAALDFSAEFGRNLEYYTGFVFDVTSPKLGPQTPIAGGGRYDQPARRRRRAAARASRRLGDPHRAAAGGGQRERGMTDKLILAAPPRAA